VFAPPLVAWRESLNPAQLAAVTCGDGPVLVIAGAGTGKTWTLACRVAFLIEQGVPPERILLLTFSRRAAREMLSRADRLVLGNRTGKVWGGTFHAIANRLLRLYGRSLGLSPDFTVLDQADMADLMDFIRGEQHPVRDKTERRFPRKDTLVSIYSRMVNAEEASARSWKVPFPGVPTMSTASAPSSPNTPAANAPRTCWTTTTCSCSGAPWAAPPPART